MTAAEYMESVREIPVSEKLSFALAVLWVHPERLPLALVSLGDETMPEIKVPAQTVSPYGNRKNIVPVTAFSRTAFQNRAHITDIILPSSVESIPAGAFAGCTNLRRITIPRKVTVLRAGAFAGCTKLESIFYEGTPEEWDAVQIVSRKHETEFGKTVPGTPVQEIVSERYLHIPGNEAIFSAEIHFHCPLDGRGVPAFHLKAKCGDLTDCFRTVQEVI